ncbi:ABC transporter ATP-binding protein [Paenarthrobacter sp. NPDC058040]|uniref:ABC transporter ATP-binding protein n=1 Tax=unclassified Paenarthrobacter TaxID=2634190 RepID=UPI0036D7CC6E
MATVTIRNVSKTFNGSTALHPLDLTVEDGSFCCMLGSSGSGKSTLLRMIAGLEQPDSGRISIGETDVTLAPPNRRNIGFVFQNYALFPHLSVLANVAFGLRSQGLSRKVSHAKAEDMLGLVGLDGFAKRSPKQLSGGQQQRVALARALVTEPDVLLLDEPLSALDRKIRGDMQRELKRIHRETGLTTIMVTHDQEEAMNLGDSVLLLSHGRVQQHGNPTAIYEHPANEFVAGFLGATPLGRGQLRTSDNGTHVNIGGEFIPLLDSPLPDSTEVDSVVMAERVTLTPMLRRPRQEGDLEGVVESIDFYGPFAQAEARVGLLRIPAMMLSQHAHGIRPGETVWISIAEGGVHAFATQDSDTDIVPLPAAN